ncbi:MAG: hypothetical protein C0515_09365 [Novosphingobium sp.]|nr:hypothetical protein [Novosphingobium sp.]MBX9643812.1 hypothetical protein [Novosphingobium sp.]
MLTTAAVVSLIASLGWLVLNWRGYRADARAAGWSRSTQFQMALLWIALISVLALLFDRVRP